MNIPPLTNFEAAFLDNGEGPNGKGPNATSDASMGKPRRCLSKATIFVACDPLGLEKLGSEIRPR